MQKIGFFGGSFDPIHFGHLKLATSLASMHGLEEVWFCPARVSPHKQDDPPTSVIHRLNMLELAVRDVPGFFLMDIEAKKEGPSYTIDTIRELVKREEGHIPERKIYLMLSDEALPGFFKWKDPEEIIKLVPLLIGSRFCLRDCPQFKGSQSILKAIEEGWSPTDVIEISSTEIRERLKLREDCTQFVPKKVLDYIYENNLYC